MDDWGMVCWGVVMVVNMTCIIYIYPSETFTHVYDSTGLTQTATAPV